MSIDFSQDYEAPLVTTSFTPADESEFSLRPKRLTEYNGQEKVKENLFTLRPHAAATSRSTMCCSTVLPASARRRSPALSPTKWACISA